MDPIQEAMDRLLAPGISALTLASYPLHLVKVARKPSPARVREWMSIYHRLGRRQVVPFLLVKDGSSWSPLCEESASQVLALAGVGEAYGSGFLVEGVEGDDLLTLQGLIQGEALTQSGCILSPMVHRGTMARLLDLGDVGDILRDSSLGPEVVDNG